MTAAYYSHLIGPMSKKVDRPVKATLPPSEIKNKKEQPTHASHSYCTLVDPLS